MASIENALQWCLIARNLLGFNPLSRHSDHAMKERSQDIAKKLQELKNVAATNTSFQSDFDNYSADFIRLGEEANIAYASRLSPNERRTLIDLISQKLSVLRYFIVAKLAEARGDTHGRDEALKTVAEKQRTVTEDERSAQDKLRDIYSHLVGLLEQRKEELHRWGDTEAIVRKINMGVAITNVRDDPAGAVRALQNLDRETYLDLRQAQDRFANLRRIAEIREQVETSIQAVQCVPTTEPVVLELNRRLQQIEELKATDDVQALADIRVLSAHAAREVETAQALQVNKKAQLKLLELSREQLSEALASTAGRQLADHEIEHFRRVLERTASLTEESSQDAVESAMKVIQFALHEYNKAAQLVAVMVREFTTRKLALTSLHTKFASAFAESDRDEQFTTRLQQATDFHDARSFVDALSELNALNALVTTWLLDSASPAAAIGEMDLEGRLVAVKRDIDRYMADPNYDGNQNLATALMSYGEAQGHWQVAAKLTEDARPPEQVLACRALVVAECALDGIRNATQKRSGLVDACNPFNDQVDRAEKEARRQLAAYASKVQEKANENVTEPAKQLTISSTKFDARLRNILSEYRSQKREVVADIERTATPSLSTALEQLRERLLPLTNTAVELLASLGEEIDRASLDGEGLVDDATKARAAELEKQLEKAWQTAVGLASSALGQLSNQGLDRTTEITVEWDKSQQVTSLALFNEEKYREATEAAGKIPGLVETLLAGDTEVKQLQAEIERQKNLIDQRVEQLKPQILERVTSELISSSEANFRITYLNAIVEEKDTALEMAECTHKAALERAKLELARIKQLLDDYDGDALNLLKQRFDTIKTNLQLDPIPEILPQLFEELETARQQLATDARKKGPAAEPDVVKLESRVRAAKITADAVKVKRQTLQDLLDDGQTVLEPLHTLLAPKKYRGEFAVLLESLKQRRDAETEDEMDDLIVEYNTKFKAEVERLARDPIAAQTVSEEEQRLVEGEQLKQRELETLERKLEEFGIASLFKFVYLENMFNNSDKEEYGAIKKELDNIKKARKDAPEYRSLIDRMTMLESRRDRLRENVQGARFAARKQFARAGAKWNTAARQACNALDSLSHEIAGTDGVEQGTSSQLASLLEGMKSDLPQNKFDDVVAVIASTDKPLKDRLQAREEGLRAVRQYKSLLPSDPFVARVSNTPFGLGVDYTPVYRTLDDLDLNLRVMVGK